MTGINSIGGQPPGPRDLFSRVDSDRSGGVSQAELQKLSDAIADKTGKTIYTGDEAFKGYDSDGNGSLSGEELRTVLDNSGFGPPRGLQGMAPPPPTPRQAAGFYADNQSDSEQNLLASLVTRMQDLLDTLKSSQEAGDQPQAQGGAPADIFGKVDTDGSGSLSKNELKVLAENIKKTTGQTLDVSDESVAALDRNGDGELSPDEIDLRKTLSMQSADMSIAPSVKDLRTALDYTWQQEQKSNSAQYGQQNTRASGSTDSLLDQMKEVKNLLDILTKYYGSKNNASDQGLRIKS